MTEEERKGLINGFETELHAILNYWINHTVDPVNGGFYGAVRNDNVPDFSAVKGSVLCSRILWTFSSAASKNPSAAYIEMADRAYQFLIAHFVDSEYRGVYWSVYPDGTVADARKQIYAQAFALYGLSAYAVLRPETDALVHARQLYELIEKHSLDPQCNGYLEAFQRDWTDISDQRLSAKDVNTPKSMNTHLHVIESYAMLFSCWPDPSLKRQIQNLLDLFEQRIVLPSAHLGLFFSNEWSVIGDLVSYGHDIEASWLLLHAASVIDDQSRIDKWKRLSISIANAAMKGLDTDGGLWYEFEPSSSELVSEKHWWPQAEAVVGLFNAHQVSANPKYLEAARKCWGFIQNHIIYHTNGEWFWGVRSDYSVMEDHDKAGFWKCPYHNSRACMEMIERLKQPY